MLAEIKKKQHELDELREVFGGLRTFDAALRRSTKNKLFDVVNSFAWASVLACSRMIVIDLAAWVDSLLPPRPPKKGVEGWLRKHVKGDALVFCQNHRAAMTRLFGKRAARRGSPSEADILRLEERLFTWAENLRHWRNARAHRYGYQTGSARVLRFPDLAKRFVACSRLMNDFRLLVDESTLVMSRTEPSTNDSTARDLVDIIVAGTIPFAVEQWNKETGQFLWQKRDAFYRRLHGQRRRKRTDPFNRRR
jgi:hypothetical protein